MPIDTSMYQNLQGLDIGGSIQKGLSLRQMVDEQKAQKKKQEEQDQVNKAYGSAMEVDANGNTVVNQGKAISALAGLNNPMGRQEAQNLQQQQAQAQKMKLERGIQEAEFIGRRLNDVKDQKSWSQALADARNTGIDVRQYENMPYDPATVNHLQGMALSVKDRLHQQNTERELAIKEREARAKIGQNGLGGKAPEGYRFRPDGSLEPIPGGPASQADVNRKEKARQDASQVVQDIGRSLSIIDESPTAAGTMDLGLMSYVPGSPTQQLDSLLDSVKSNIGFDKLQAMRAASPTGGALGSVSDKESAMLQATAGKLSSNMPEDQLKDNLRRLANQYNDIVHGKGKGPKRFQLSFDENGNPVKPRIVKAPHGNNVKVVEGVSYRKVDGGWEEIPMPASR